MAAGAGEARQQTIRFGEFELDLSCQTLSHNGVPIKLQKQPFQVLGLLVERAPKIVSREEIRQHVWGDTVYIDATQSINFCIRQIRLALGDTSARPGFIETLPRQGYRFIAPLQGASANTSIPEHRPAQGARPRLAIGRPLVASLAAFIALATMVVVHGWLSKPITVHSVVRITPVSTYAGDEREPSLSPDGRQVAFSWDGENAGKGIFMLRSSVNSTHSV